MKIILKIAWRNIWRNPRRTWVLVTSIAVGVLGYLGTTGFSRGFLKQMVEATINLHGGHIMITAKGFHDNPQIRLFIQHPQRIEDILNDIPGIQYAPLISFQGMINSSETASGVVINGVVPNRESQITTISGSIIQGRYLNVQNGQHDIVIGELLAKKLNVEIGEKVVLMTSDLENNINSGAYRIVGLYRSSSPDFDKTFVYLNKKQAQNLAGYKNEVTAFTVKIKETLNLEFIVNEIKSNLNHANLEVLSWRERNPLLVLALDAYDNSIVIIVVILFIAIAFSIANSFLMVIYERIHELGIMMANGILPKKIRRILYTEAFFITLIGTMTGFLISAGILGYLGHSGLDLSAFAQGLGKFGVGSLVYPEIAAIDVILGLLVINVVVFLSVLYPAIKASRFEVVEAIRFE
ncbi:MAG: ABC transporter permease [bacterium]